MPWRCTPSIKPLKPQLTFEQTESDTPRRRSLFQATLADLKPSWRSTDLGLALVTASDVMRGEEDDGSEENLALRGEIVVVTDYSTGSNLERLANYQWPPTCRVRIERIAAPLGNVRMNVLASEAIAADPDATDSTSQVAVRLVNQADATREQFTLQWCDAKGSPLESAATKSVVPPGTTFLVKMNRPPS